MINSPIDRSIRLSFFHFLSLGNARTLLSVRRYYFLFLSLSRSLYLLPLFFLVCCLPSLPRSVPRSVSFLTFFRFLFFGLLRFYCYSRRFICVVESAQRRFGLFLVIQLPFGLSSYPLPFSPFLLCLNYI